MYDRTYYQEVPAHLLDSLDRYAKSRIPTGQALQSLLENNLRDWVSHADTESFISTRQIVKYAYNQLPSGCWGSREKVQAWLNGGDDNA